MRVLLYLMLAAACTLADKNDNRRNKLPFVADAVGNSLPPPSSVPASVGSPVNLATPDRYEFYTFDESGELVKRLMTLEEIQAIVAAGEETEGLVTFANDNQPTVSFNINQPPYTKVHSVVTNVQNVLKAQMEAHKNKPLLQPTLDTPDVSDSWSLILPSIFGNTGVDIVLDKTSGGVTTPETETLEEQIENDENSLSKEGNNQVLSSSSTKVDEKVVVTEITPPKENKNKEVSTTKGPVTVTSTTTTTTTTLKPTTTTKTVPIPTRRPIISTTKRLSPASKITTASVPQTKATNKPRTTTTTIKPTTPKPVVKTTIKITTEKPESTSKKQVVSASTVTDIEDIKVQIHHNSNAVSSTEKNKIEFEKISTFIPVSTVKYVTDRTTQKPIVSTKSSVAFASTTKRSVITTVEVPTSQATKVQSISTTFKPVVNTLSSFAIAEQNEELHNTTTITTQSVSPSTTVSTTEFLSADKVNLPSNVENRPSADDSNNGNYSEPLLLFDVAQSISQIASDLGGNYQPIPTTSNLLDSTNESQLELESKENLDMDIPFANGNETDLKLPDMAIKNNENFIQISTIDPHNKNEEKKPEEKIEIENTTRHEISEKYTIDNKKTNIIIDTVQKVEFTTTPTTVEHTTIDRILSDSMDDLLSQVVNQAPTIIDSEKQSEEDSKVTTTESNTTPTTTEALKDAETTTEISLKINKDISTTTEKLTELVPEKDVTNITEKELVSKIDLSKQTESPEKKNVVAAPKPNNNSTKVNNEIDKSDSNEQNFVQISGSAAKNDSKLEHNKFDNSKIKDLTTSIVAEDKKGSTHTPQENKIIKNESKIISEPGLDKISELTTVLPEVDVPNKNITTNKITQSTVNKIHSKDKPNSINKKDESSNTKLPEPLPKIDDFKKKIQKVNIDEEELVNQRNNSWKLIPTLSPPKANEIPKDKLKSDSQYNPDNNENKDIILEFSNENQGLEVTTKDLGEDIARFSELSNELAFRYWNVIVDEIDKRRSFVFSPYSTFSMLAMIFMGARGATSGEMNEILKLDDMVTFNPHFALKNISDSIETGPQTGVAVSAFTRELYSDRNKGKILTFYKERAQHFYNGHVEEINFKLISDIIRRRTNLLIKRYTWGKIPEYMKTNNIIMQAPLAAFTANIFETDCTGTSVEGRDGEMYFVVSPNVRQRRLVPVPAVVYKKGFLAGYDPVLDVTVAALGNTNTVISTMFLMPGQQGNVVHVDDLEKLEQRLLEATPTTPTWNRVLRSLLPRSGLELQIPRFSHKSTFNASLTLKKMGLKDLFDGEHADLGGLNGPSKDLYLSDMVQLNTFVTCGEGVVGEQHHVEEYPETLTVSQRRRARWLNDWDEPRDYQRAFHDPHDVSDAMHLPLHLRPRQARLPARSTQPARLKFDRPFLFFVRHNPSGMILYFGRYNPRLLP